MKLRFLAPHQLKPAGLGLAWAATVAVAYHLGHQATDHAPAEAQATATMHAPSPSDLSSRSQLSSSTNASQNGLSETVPLAPEATDVPVLNFTEELAARLALPLGPERNRALHKLFAQWAESDGAAALAATAQVSEPLLRYELRESSLNHWARKDPESAWKHLKTATPGELPDNPGQIVMQGLGKGDIATSLAFFSNHNQGDLAAYMDSASSAFDQLYQRGGHDQLIAWTQTLPAGGMKDGATNRIIDQWARYDPAAAEKWMESQLAQNPKNTVKARIELTESWARVNPQEALGFVNQLPANQRDAAYYEAIYRRWLDYDKTAAAAFLAEQPASPILDRQFERYAYDVMNQNPSATMPWAESITDPDRRWKAISRVASAWRKQDPNGLNNFVTGATYLTQDQKAQLLQTKK